MRENKASSPLCTMDVYIASIHTMLPSRIIVFDVQIIGRVKVIAVVIQLTLNLPNFETHQMTYPTATQRQSRATQFVSQLVVFHETAAVDCIISLFILPAFKLITRPTFPYTRKTHMSNEYNLVFLGPLVMRVNPPK